ncbi:MAG: DMT family transporter [Elainella sp. C42_A2020_010]|nr:DMT family transporter [Elainella sp. C42_A2020_010]
MLLTDFRGELAALSAALLWALASFIYARLGKQMSPLWLNLTKSSLAVGMILLTLVLRRDASPQLEWNSFMLLFLSGAVGIGFGDSVFFAALTNLGARRALLLEAIAPPLSACLAFVFLDEHLGLTAWLGILLTVVGVAWVIVERTPEQTAVLNLKRGVILGLLAALAQSSGAVLSRAALAETAVSPLWSSLIRLAAAVTVLLLWLGRHPSWQALQPLRSGRFLTVITAAAFAGTYLGIWLQQTALKFTETGIAQALIATSPLFIIPIAMLTGERVSFRAILGALIALAGVWLLFAG